MRIIGHRGYAGIAPENTLASFAKAIEAGCDLVELDVQLTSDRVPIVIHDATLDRTCAGRGRVIDHEAVELEKMSAGYAEKFGSTFEDEHLQRLVSVLRFLRGRAQVLIEIKGESVFEDREDIERTLIDAVESEDMVENACAISFEPLALLRVKRLCPRLNTGFLVGHDELGRGLDKAVEIGASLILYHRSQVDPMKVDLAHSRGLLCAIYNVDDPKDLAPFLSIGLDGIGSNFPGDLIRFIRNRAVEPLRLL